MNINSKQLKLIPARAISKKIFSYVFNVHERVTGEEGAQSANTDERAECLNYDYQQPQTDKTCQIHVQSCNKTSG